jgi:hypothetical protein
LLWTVDIAIFIIDTTARRTLLGEHFFHTSSIKAQMFGTTSALFFFYCTYIQKLAGIYRA